MVHNQAAEVANYSESIKQAYNKFVDEWASKLDELESHLSASLSDSNNTLESIKTLLKEVENENEQYKWSNDMTQKQMQQMESFMEKLNEFLMKAEKGGEK
jgi:flagellar biosynthesis chaperone FliJ